MEDKHTDVGVYEGKFFKKRKKKERKQKRHTDEN